MTLQPRPLKGEIVDKDAIAIGDLYRRARASIVDSVRYAIEAGHRLTKKKEELAHGEWLPWLKANAGVLGFESRFTAAKLMNGATKCAASGTFDEQHALEANRLIWGHNAFRTSYTGQFENHTPPEYIEAARKVLGAIDLDPASNNIAQKIVKAKKYYTIEDDGLSREWHGRVWLNPPYHRDLILPFVNKMVEEYLAKRVTAAIMLTNNCTETKWFRTGHAAAAAICFPHERIRFKKNGTDAVIPTNGQAFFYFGDDVERFADTFRHIGIGAIPHWKYRT
jgi:phage N-6-adenine-methyltransferase